MGQDEEISLMTAWLVCDQKSWAEESGINAPTI